MRKICYFIFLAITFLFISPFAFAQNVDQATRETDLYKPRDKIAEELQQAPRETPEVIPEKPVVKKEGEKEFFVKKIELTGCESFSPQEFSSIVSKYENRNVTMSELENLSNELEREYLKRGVIAAVLIPAQEIKEEIVTLQVVEAKMGELKIPDHKYFKQSRLSYYWKLKPGETMRFDKISKSLQLMNKNPDRQVKSTLLAGEKPGTTDVMLDVKTHFPVHLTSSFDREGVVSTGRGRTGIGFRHDNLLGFDDILFGGYSFGTHFNGFYAFHSLPINSDGLSLLYGYSNSKSMPKKEFAPYGIKANSDNISLSLHQDLYKKDVYLGEAYVEFDANDKTTWLNTGTYSRDRLRIFRLGGSFVKREVGSVTSINPEISQGVDAFGASSRGNPLASRGAKSNFTKFNFGLQHKRALPFNLQVGYKLKTQVSSTKLTPQEEFSLGGIDSVRGYPAGDYLADNSVLNSVELLIPSIFIPKSWRLPYSKSTIRDDTTLVAFVDYGHGNRRGALDFETKSMDLVGVGAGLRFNLFNQVLLRLEWGFPVGDRPLTQAGRSYFHFSVDLQEKLPATIENYKQKSGSRNL
ncbi:MAG: BamA/TamA family outer membrane protein [Candidatus Omnitrophica bacterium]|nr:BamA/TamA family outer membrane protein [Candidatus Omnitrophota bacterium]MBU1870461.1 BamA/TamA family outer membrane protein [Candidatus Omnitrophota bacterium]